MGGSRPICVQCSVEMHCKKNDVLVVDYRMLSNDEPEPEKQLLNECWSADLWECPKCGRQVVPPHSYGSKPLAYTSTDILKWIGHYKAQGEIVINNYEYRGSA